MSNSLNLLKFISSNSYKVGSRATSDSSKYGRVVDIILNENHPQYIIKGGGKAINGIFYRNLTKDEPENNPATLAFAYQSTQNIKTVPTIGEIVEIKQLPTSRTSKGISKQATYYTRIVNIWNNPNSNTYLDVFRNSTLDISLNGEFEQASNINPLQSAVGDVQIEGRQGQSIRFTGAKGLANPFIDESNKNKPVILLSNGQVGTENGFITINEDINNDPSSIYIVSDHQIPLEQASKKRLSWDNPPTEADQFKGNQILINTGRLFINAKQHDIQLSSIESIGLNTQGTINLDSTDYMCFDGSQIFLGQKARTAPQNSKEAVLLGNQTENFLNNVLNLLEGMADDMAKAKTIDGKPIPLLNKRGLQAKPVIEVLKRQINPNGPSQLKSKKVFTE